MSKELSIITKDKIQLVKDTICRGATDDELELFMLSCNRTGLDPFQKQCWAVKRWDSGLGREVMTFQTGVDGFRIIANRSEKYSGQVGPFWCDENGHWQDVWLKSTPPVAVKVGVLRSDFKEPLWAVARFSGYAARKKDGSLTPFWSKMPDLMIAKVAECLALRKAFPQDLSGVYSDTEMEQATPVKEAVLVNEPIKIEDKKEAPPAKEADPIAKTEIKEKAPEVFPDKTKIKINKEQAESLKTIGENIGYSVEQISHMVYTLTKKIRWSELNYDEYETIVSSLKDNPKTV